MHHWEVFFQRLLCVRVVLDEQEMLARICVVCHWMDCCRLPAGLTSPFLRVPYTLALQSAKLLHVTRAIMGRIASHRSSHALFHHWLQL